MDAGFHTLMAEVGYYGPFQKTFTVVFIFLHAVVLGMQYLNIVLAMTVPEHWCHVPGRRKTNLSLVEWKEVTVPRKEGEESLFSKCKMYAMEPDEDISNMTLIHSGNITGCRHGWDFDTTWYSSTAPMEQHWVCDRALYVSSTFAANCVGDVLGAFIMGQLSDTIGRKPVFFLTVSCLLLGRCLSVVSSGTYWLFLASAMLGNLCLASSYQSVLATGIEVMPSEKKAFTSMLQFVGWGIGHTIMPLVAWASGDWRVFMLASTLPLAAFFIMFRSFPESPRWLATRGHSKRCLDVLQYIAATNGTTLSPGAMATLEKMAGHKEEVYGVASLFSSWRLAKNTALVSITWIVNYQIYYTIVLNISTMSGNPFLNYTWQSLVELPANILSRLLTDTCGRRWTHSGFFLLQIPIYLVIVSIVREPNLSWLSTTLVVMGKFCVSCTYYVLYLQAMENFPTCIRQSGAGFATLLGAALGTLGPYVVYLGTSVDARLPFAIMAVLSVVGMLASSLLPETLNCKLPETLTDAHSFGAEQKYWSWPSPKPKDTLPSTVPTSMASADSGDSTNVETL